MKYNHKTNIFSISVLDLLIVGVVILIIAVTIAFISNDTTEYQKIKRQPIMSKVNYIDICEDYFTVEFENGRKWKVAKVLWMKNYYVVLKDCKNAKNNDWDVRVWFENGVIHQSTTDGESILNGSKD